MIKVRLGASRFSPDLAHMETDCPRKAALDNIGILLDHKERFSRMEIDLQRRRIKIDLPITVLCALHFLDMLTLGMDIDIYLGVRHSLAKDLDHFPLPDRILVHIDRRRDIDARYRSYGI
jgi:hypothetical protein